jgi:ABC-type multidrug transport system ATPase subunit
MQIVAENLGKRFNLEWIFRDLGLNFQANKSYAITGANGSGKSTLLQVISGIMPFSEGKLIYSKGKLNIPPDEIYKYLSIAAPYQELIEEFTLSEQIDFHLKFKNFRKEISKEQFIEILQLQKSISKEIRFFSSGMKQRVKLGLAMYSDTSILLLDEPTTNLDSQGTDWYLKAIKENIQDRLVIICSNQRHEYDFCDEVIEMRKQ